MITRICRLLVVCIITFSFIIASDQPSSQTIVWQLKTPVYLRGNASILCMIYEDEKPGHMAWTKAGQLIVLQNASLYPTKYDVSVKYHRKTLMYSLVIKNINMGDLNLVYKCESGFSSAEGILPLNEETFVAIPQNQDVTRNFTLKGGYLKAFVEVSSVYPKPRCVAVYKEKDITGYSDSNYTRESLLYSMKFDLVYQTNECGKINISCVIGKEKSSILLISHEFNTDCEHSNTVSGNLYVTEVAGIIAGVVVLAAVASGLFFFYRRRRRRRHFGSEYLPETIKYIYEAEKKEYHKLMQSSNTEKRYFVRIMLVGKQSAGKTSLKRRLLKEDISDVTSTDGVDIVVRRCKINIEDGTWIIGKEVDDGKVSRIKRALTQNSEDKDTKDTQVHTTKDIHKRQRDEIFSFNEDTTTDTTFSLDKSEDANESSLLLVPDDSTIDSEVNLENYKEYKKEKDSSALVIPVEFTSDAKDKIEDMNESSFMIMHDDLRTETNTRLDNYEESNDSSSLIMPVDLISSLFSRSTINTSSNNYALCELWDFAGQKEFYATHQAFLTSSAVYLVVANMEDDISKQGLSQCFADFQHIGEYVDFWFNCIHCYRTTDKPNSNGHFQPPILLVFTGKDQYNQADFKKREQELNDQIDKVLGHQSAYHHLHYRFYLSNLIDTDEVFQKLRYTISETAQQLDTWGNTFPLKWILLEHLIEINKNEGTNFVGFNDMVSLAKHPDINILEENELLLFLRFQHNVGNITFYENIRDLIILNPQWLADAFRCLVSDRVGNRRLYNLEDWALFKRQGKISESLVTELFLTKDGSQFSGQKKNLHAVMNKLDILVKIDNSNYIMPSMMPSAKFEDVCEKFGILTAKCKRTSWLCYKFEFLPPYFFNHLSAWFIRNYNPSKLDSGIALYRGICVFDIDRSGCKILVTMSNDTIALQVISFAGEEGFVSTCSDIYSKVTQCIEDIKKRFRVEVSFKLHFKCSDGYYHKDTFEYEKLTSEKECFCPEHMKAHRCDLLYLPWIENEDMKRSTYMSSHKKWNLSMDG